LSKIRYWQQRAGRIARYKNPAKALVDYWALEKRFAPLEEHVTLAVIKYEDEIDAQIHSINGPQLTDVIFKPTIDNCIR
jgi:hypothetical protein